MGKSKVMRCTRNEDGARLNVMLNGEALEADQFKYLGQRFSTWGSQTPRGSQEDFQGYLND